MSLSAASLAPVLPASVHAPPAPPVLTPVALPAAGEQAAGAGAVPGAVGMRLCILALRAWGVRLCWMGAGAGAAAVLAWSRTVDVDASLASSKVSTRTRDLQSLLLGGVLAAAAVLLVLLQLLTLSLRA